MKTFYVTKYGITISGLGRNNGTLDSSFSTKQTAIRHAKKLKSEFPQSNVAVETMTQGEVWEIK